LWCRLFESNSAARDFNTDEAWKKVAKDIKVEHAWSDITDVPMLLSILSNITIVVLSVPSAAQGPACGSTTATVFYPREGPRFEQSIQDLKNMRDAKREEGGRVRYVKYNGVNHFEELAQPAFLQPSALLPQPAWFLSALPTRRDFWDLQTSQLRIGPYKSHGTDDDDGDSIAYLGGSLETARINFTQRQLDTNPLWHWAMTCGARMQESRLTRKDAWPPFIARLSVLLAACKLPSSIESFATVCRHTCSHGVP
jgi:hypothetical protein